MRRRWKFPQNPDLILGLFLTLFAASCSSTPEPFTQSERLNNPYVAPTQPLWRPKSPPPTLSQTYFFTRAEFVERLISKTNSFPSMTSMPSVPGGEDPARWGVDTSAITERPQDAALRSTQLPLWMNALRVEVGLRVAAFERRMLPSEFGTCLKAYSEALGSTDQPAPEYSSSWAYTQCLNRARLDIDQLSPSQRVRARRLWNGHLAMQQRLTQLAVEEFEEVSRAYRMQLESWGKANSP